MRQVVYLLAPVLTGDQRAQSRGVAVLAQEVEADVKRFLDQIHPADFYQPSHLQELERLVLKGVKRPLAPGCERRLDMFYATRSDTPPRLNVWLDWIERLEERGEKDPFALALLTRHQGGVFVVRIEGSIVAYCGLRAYSSDVWEVTHPRLTASPKASLIARPDDLFTALIARATRAATDRRPGATPDSAEPPIPICTITPRDRHIRRALDAAGYKPYASASVYATTA